MGQFWIFFKKYLPSLWKPCPDKSTSIATAEKFQTRFVSNGDSLLDLKNNHEGKLSEILETWDPECWHLKTCLFCKTT